MIPRDWNPTEAIMAFAKFYIARGRELCGNPDCPSCWEVVWKDVHDFGMLHGLDGVREGWEEAIRDE